LATRLNEQAAKSLKSPTSPNNRQNLRNRYSLPLQQPMETP
jgi:hypothetical protein